MMYIEFRYSCRCSIYDKNKKSSVEISRSIVDIAQDIHVEEAYIV